MCVIAPWRANIPPVQWKGPDGPKRFKWLVFRGWISFPSRINLSFNSLSTSSKLLPYRGHDSPLIIAPSHCFHWPAPSTLPRHRWGDSTNTAYTLPYLMTDDHLWQYVQLKHNISITTANIMMMMIVTIMTRIIITISIILYISNIINNNDMHYNF